MIDIARYYLEMEDMDSDEDYGDPSDPNERATRNALIPACASSSARASLFFTFAWIEAFNEFYIEELLIGPKRAAVELRIGNERRGKRDQKIPSHRVLKLLVETLVPGHHPNWTIISRAYDLRIGEIHPTANRAGDAPKSLEPHEWLREAEKSLRFVTEPATRLLSAAGKREFAEILNVFTR